MKAEARAGYEALAEVSGYLCNFCRFATFYGSCGEAEPECGHPLEVVQAILAAGDPVERCWGFRPRYNIDEAADITGIMLRGEWAGDVVDAVPEGSGL